MKDITVWRPKYKTGKHLADEIIDILSSVDCNLNVFDFDDIKLPYLFVDCTTHAGSDALSIAISIHRKVSKED